jgi:diacylglycerol kinase family enzyme
MRAMVFHNPTAGANGSEKEAILSALKLAGIQAGYFSVKKPDWEKALGKSVDLIVAAGGDGTIGKIMRAMPDRSVPVAILPLGTANNVARSLGIAGTPQELVETWKIEHTFPLNLGAIKGIDNDTVSQDSDFQNLRPRMARRRFCPKRMTASRDCGTSQRR